jgi:hypothetical protein
MHSHWRYRLAGLAAVLAVAVAAGPAQLAIGQVAKTAVADSPPPCPDGTHWDDILHICL